MTPAAAPAVRSASSIFPEAKAEPVSGASFSELSNLAGSASERSPVDAAFERWWKHIPRVEGTLKQWHANTENRHDRGGRTNFGITERAFMGCAGAAGLPKTAAAFESMTVQDAKKIARSIWKTSGASRIADPGVAVVVGDWFWGSNTHAWKGIKGVLESLGSDPGSAQGLDSQAIAALNALPSGLLVEKISEARAQHHLGLAASDTSQRVFLSGWQSRVLLMQSEALSRSAKSPENYEAEPPGLRRSALLVIRS